MRLPLVLLALCFIAFSYGEYAHFKQILPRYTIYWTVDEGEGVIYLALNVQTLGWIGFGIGEYTSGSMPGADMVIGTVQLGQGNITDRYSEAFSLPKIDACQDWTLISYHESEGFTTIEMKRALNTSDAQDRVITPGPMKILVAFGETYTIGYHSVNRLITEIVFYGPDDEHPPPPSDAMTVEYHINNISIGNGQTHYGCQTFLLPSDQKYYIYQIDPLLQPSTASHVHHFIVHICQNVSGGSVERFMHADLCKTTPDSGISGCNGILYAWGPGGGSAILPEVAGFVMGEGETSVRYLVIEVHYNNANGVGGYQDNTGFRVHYTKQPRKYEADVLAIGDPYVMMKQTSYIPAAAITEFEFECPSECTQRLPHPITIFTSGPHMHAVGYEFWTTQWRDGVQINEFGRVEYWSFENQQQQLINITLQPGDRLNTHCVYDTRSKSTVTLFGPDSTDEMCIHFMGYYPRITSPTMFQYCGFSGANLTMCGAYSTAGVIQYNNPTIRDPPGGANRTFGIPGQCQIKELSSTSDSPQLLQLAFVVVLSITLLLF